jgi:hypothetical protein
VAIGLTAIAVTARPAAAECDGPISSFRAVAGSAERVVIGDVAAIRDGGLAEAWQTGGWSSRFTLQVRYSPVGDAPSTLAIDDLPTQPCAPVMMAREGDRIAIAFGATDFTPPIRVNTIAVIDGRPYEHPGIETITTSEVFRLLGLVPPDTSTSLDEGSDPPAPGLLGVIGAALLAGGLAWRRSGPRPQIVLKPSNGWRQPRQ